MKITREEMIAALAKAQAELAPILKEIERDENGRFAGGGGSSSDKAEAASDKAWSMNAKVDTKAEYEKISDAHAAAAQKHEDAAGAARAAGDTATAEHHDSKAREHYDVADDWAASAIGRK